MRTHHHLMNVLIFLLIGFLWGLNWPAVKFLLTEIKPLSIRAISFTAAAFVLGIATILLKQPLRLKKDEAAATAIVGVFLIAGFNVLTAFGQLFLEASKAAIIAYTMPTLTAILATIFLRERLEKNVVLALLIAMFGLGILASEDLDLLIKNPIGSVIMLFAALCWAIGNVAMKSKRWSLKPLPLTAWFFAFSSLVTWPLALIWEPLWKQNWPSSHVLATLAYHVLGPMVICYILWSVLVSRLPATVAAVSALTAPVVGVLSSALLLGETLSWQKGIALAAILFSIALTTIIPKRKQTNSATCDQNSSTTDRRAQENADI